VAKVGELPAAPVIIGTTIRLTSNLDSNLADISRVLSSDQSLTAKVIRLSNSPFYGRTTSVETLQEAILVLGFMAVRSLVLATATHALFDQGPDDAPQMKLWRHSLSTAISARQLAKHLNHPDKEQIFVCGLMHDIGKLVLLQKLPEQYQEVIDQVEESAGSFLSSETKIITFTHCDVASMLLETWDFPVSLIRAISQHHRPQSFRPGSPIPVSQVVYLANLMAKNLDVGFADERIDDLSALDSAVAMSLDKDSLDEVLEEVRDNYLAEMKVFDEI